MKLPNWFRVGWWAILAGIVTWFLWLRRASLLNGEAKAFDVVVVVIWIALLLAPVFSEVSVFGMKLKQEIKELKSHVDAKFLAVEAELHNSVDVRSHFNPQITFSTPPPDTQLPVIEKQVREALESAFKTIGLDRIPQTDPLRSPRVPPENVYFFEIRYSIERELQRIWMSRFPAKPGERALLAARVLPSLVEAQLITPEIAKAIRDVYAVCSPAIHGVDVTDAQKRFVEHVAPYLLRTLTAIN